MANLVELFCTNPETRFEEIWASRSNPSQVNILWYVHCGFDAALLSFVNVELRLNDALNRRDGERTKCSWLKD